MAVAQEKYSSNGSCFLRNDFDGLVTGNDTGNSLNMSLTVMEAM